MVKKRIRRSFTDANGERHFGEGSTVEEAIIDRERIRFEIEHGIYTNSDMTVSALADLWLDMVRNRRITEKTYKAKASIVNNTIKPKLGRLKARDVRQVHIMQVLNEEAAVHTQDRINKVMSAFNGMFNAALANGICVIDPCRAIEKPQGRPVAIRREATLTERNIYLGHLIWLDMVILCGLRPGETAQVTFADIHEGYMWVDGTKNKNATRYVPLPAELRKRILAVPHTFGSEHVCNMRDNKRSRQWLKLVSEIGLPESDLEPYCFRHSFVTDLENCPGLSQAAIKTIVGHAISGVTDRYTHSRPETCTETLPILIKYWDKIGLKTGEKSVTCVTQAT